MPWRCRRGSRPRGEAGTARHALTARGDGRAAVALALLAARTAAPAADDAWGHGWDAVAEGRIALR